MPLDPNIALAVKPPAFNNPFEVLAQMQHLKQQGQVIRSNQAVEEKNRQDIAKQAREEEVNRKFFSIIASSKDPDEAEARIQADAPELLQIFREQRMKLDKTAAEINADKLKAKEIEASLKQKGADYLGPVLQMVKKSGYDPKVFDFALNLAGSQFEGLPVDQLRQQGGNDPQRIAQIVAGLESPQQQNANVNAETAAVELPGKAAEAQTRQQVLAGMRGGLTPDQQRQAAAQAAAAAETGRHNRASESLDAQRIAKTGADGPLETIIGPNGKPIRVPRAQAIGKETVAGQEKPSSGQQKRVLAFFNRAEQADTELEKLEDEIQKQSVAGQAWMSHAPNFMQTQMGQSYNAAQRAFTEARLRKDSGAAIPEQEFTNDKRTYFAQAGDSKETLEQKRRARAAILSSLAFESGQALGEFVGDPEEAKRIAATYKQRAAGGVRGNTVKMRAPNGLEQDVPADQVDHFKSLGATVVK